jgi:hypothetical protein
MSPISPRNDSPTLIGDFPFSGSRESAVGKATGYEIDDRGVGFLVALEGKIFLLFTSSRPVLVHTQPAIQWLLGIFLRR